MVSGSGGEEGRAKSRHGDVIRILVLLEEYSS